MNRIIEKDGIFFCCDRPIPPRYWLRCEAELVIRLYANTRRTAWWEAGEDAARALNAAPYRPMLRARVSRFMWGPPGEVDIRGRNIVAQFGKILNWAAWVVEPLPDPQREFLVSLLGEIGGQEPDLRQGSLEIRYLLWPDQFEAHAAPKILRREGIMRGKNGGFWLFNHYVSDSSDFFRRAVGDKFYALACFDTAPVVWVLSPDHPDQPLSLPPRLPLVLFAHPFPRRDGGID